MMMIMFSLFSLFLTYFYQQNNKNNEVQRIFSAFLTCFSLSSPPRLPADLLPSLPLPARLPPPPLLLLFLPNMPNKHVKTGKQSCCEQQSKQRQHEMNSQDKEERNQASLTHSHSHVHSYAPAADLDVGLPVWSVAVHQPSSSPHLPIFASGRSIYQLFAPS